MPPPIQLGIGLTLPRIGGGVSSPYLLDWNFLNGLPADFAALHSRASGATYVDSSGKIAWAAENTTPESKSVAAWATSPLRVETPIEVAGGPIGSYELCQAEAGNNSHLYRRGIDSSFRNVSHTKMLRCKKGTARYLKIGSGSEVASWDWDTEAFVAEQNVTGVAFPDPYGDGWYYVGVWTSADQVGAYTDFGPSADSAASFYFNATGTETVLVADVCRRRMFVPPTSVDDFISNPTASAYYAPRLTHDPVTLEPLGYLHEPQATNIAINSNLFYALGSAVVTANSAISPSGQTDAWLCSGADGSWGGNYLGAAGTYPVSSSTEYVGSVWIKAAPSGSATTVDVMTRDNSTGVLSINTIVPSSEWQRANVSITTGAATTSCRMLFGNADGDFLIWQTQFEEGSVATSLIPTYGAAVVRQADSVSNFDIPTLPDKSGFSLIQEFIPLDTNNRMKVGGIENGVRGVSIDYARNASLHYINDRNDALLANADFNFSRTDDTEPVMKIALSWSPERRAVANSGAIREEDLRQLDSMANNGFNEYASPTEGIILRSTRVAGSPLPDAKLQALTTP